MMAASREPTRVGVLLSGRGSNLRALVAAQDGYAVVAVASDGPDAPGIAWAAERGIPTLALAPREAGGKAGFEERIGAFLRDHRTDLIALAGYMRLLSPSFVAHWPGRILNIHPSLLPRHKGLDTHARAIAAGDAEAGCSVHVVTDELDAGRVLGQARVPILPGDTADALAARVLVQEHLLYPRILSEYARTMADPLARVRQAAFVLPAVTEGPAGVFAVAGEPFARMSDGILQVRGDDGWAEASLGHDADWAAIDDGIARAWELAAPTGLLEAGGR